MFNSVPSSLPVNDTGNSVVSGEPRTIQSFRIDDEDFGPKPFQTWPRREKRSFIERYCTLTMPEGQSGKSKNLQIVCKCCGKQFMGQIITAMVHLSGERKAGQRMAACPNASDELKEEILRMFTLDQEYAESRRIASLGYVGDGDLGTIEGESAVGGTLNSCASAQQLQKLGGNGGGGASEKNNTMKSLLSASPAKAGMAAAAAAAESASNKEAAKLKRSLKRARETGTQRGA
jgi:hypothetical protein